MHKIGVIHDWSGLKRSPCRIGRTNRKIWSDRTPNWVKWRDRHRSEWAKSVQSPVWIRDVIDHDVFGLSVCQFIKFTNYHLLIVNIISIRLLDCFTCWTLIYVSLWLHNNITQYFTSLLLTTKIVLVFVRFFSMNKVSFKFMYKALCIVSVVMVTFHL